MKSVMTHKFSEVPRAEIPRSSFDRSHGLKTTFDAGYLVPILVDEALPGDTFKCSMTGFARLATPIYPLLDNMRMETFFFAVPYRLIWENWEKFNGAQTDPGDSTDFTVPTITFASAHPEESLGDYFGIPTAFGSVTTNALHYRAYNLIYNEWFRDQNLQDSVYTRTNDGPDAGSGYTLLRRGKRHDYFTSALPWPQKGDSVPLPLGSLAPVVGIGKANQTYGTGTSVYETGGTGTTAYTNEVRITSTGTDTDFRVEEDPNNAGFPGIYADLSTATAATINQLRQAFQIQKLLERDARGGTRYTEIIKSHFGVTSPDQRLQRPEYLGGGSTPVNITPVPQTSSTDATTPQGNLSAYGVSHLSNHGFTQSFTEHCIILGLINVRADLNYQQGLNRMWSRQTRFDYYWPALAMVGEQAILNKEIYYGGTSVDDDTFGYQERYAEYRYKPSMVTGKFRSNAAGGLDAWHLAQDFASLPLLNDAFIQDDPPIDRVIAVPSEPHFLFDAYFQYQCARPMPTFGVPGLIDHF